MTVAPGARLRQLAEAVEEHRNGPHWWGDAERTLHNLAPSLAVLCVDMADALEREYDLHTTDALERINPCGCEPCATTRALLARFRALTQEPT